MSIKNRKTYISSERFTLRRTSLFSLFRSTSTSDFMNLAPFFVPSPFLVPTLWYRVEMGSNLHSTLTEIIYAILHVCMEHEGDNYSRLRRGPNGYCIHSFQVARHSQERRGVDADHGHQLGSRKETSDSRSTRTKHALRTFGILNTCKFYASHARPLVLFFGYIQAQYHSQRLSSFCLN